MRLRPPDHLARAAFTLIELLCVIAIISLIVGITMPAVGRSKDVARQVKCTVNLRSFGPAFEMYRKDYKEILPRAAPYPQPAGGPLPITDPGVHEVLGAYLETQPNIREIPGDPTSKFVMADPYFCPNDTYRGAGVDEATDPDLAGARAGISYFYWGGALMYAREIFSADTNATFTVTKFYEQNPTYPVLADVRDFHPRALPMKKNALYFGDWRADILQEDPGAALGGGNP